MTELRVRRPALTFLPLALGLIVACGGGPVTPVVFPEPAQGGPRAAITRVELENRLATLPSASAETHLVQARLRDGDFQVGDKIFLRVLEDTALTDTFTVRAGRTLELPLLPPIPLTGVLRSELQPYLEEKVGQYVRNPTLEVTPLLRVALLGGVGAPGYYNIPADVILSDAVMLAGGPTSNVRLDKSKVERMGVEIYNADGVQTALTQGVTLDRMSLVGGDIVDIGKDELSRTESLLRTIGLLLAIPLSIAAVAALF